MSDVDYTFKAIARRRIDATKVHRVDVMEAQGRLLARLLLQYISDHHTEIDVSAAGEWMVRLPYEWKTLNIGVQQAINQGLAKFHWRIKSVDADNLATLVEQE